MGTHVLVGRTQSTVNPADPKVLLDGEQFGSPSGSPPSVRVRVCVLNIYEINAQERTWQGKIHLEASWHDPTLWRDKREHEEWPDPDADLWPQQCPFVAGQNKRWTPRLEIENCRRDFSRETWYKVYYKGKEVDQEGREKIINFDWPVVEYNLVIRGMFTFEFQPHRFPFDVQELPVRVRSNRSIPSEDASRKSESFRHFAHICLDERKGHPSKVPLPLVCLLLHSLSLSLSLSLLARQPARGQMGSNGAPN